MFVLTQAFTCGVRKSAQISENVEHRLLEVGCLKRPGPGVGECFLVRVEDFLLVVAFSILEELEDRIVELAVQDGLEAALGSVELL